MQFARSRSSRCVPLPDDPVSTLETVKTVWDWALNFSGLCERIVYCDIPISEEEYVAGFHVCVFVCWIFCLFKIVSSRQTVARKITRHVARGTCHVHNTLGTHNKTDCVRSYVAHNPSKLLGFPSFPTIRSGIAIKICHQNSFHIANIVKNIVIL